MTTRLRFAPSPTGLLHLGGARTALFNWLYAKHTGGKFLLRIEDTDEDRNSETSVAEIINGMAWLGMSADEPMVVQSTRFDAHRQLALQLEAKGLAYKCFCTPEEIEAMRARAMEAGGALKYDGTWRDRTDHPTDGRPYVIRFKMPQGGTTTLDDMVLGPITVGDTELDDLIILRSDGTPTYNFVVVCDDAHMAITHVVRGQDHVTNTFRQIHMYAALGAPLPRFAHLPMIEGLSKRKGSAGVTAYRDRGFLPEAVINYLARLGWSHGDQEIFTIQELIDLFDLTDVNKGSGRFDEEKLLWVNEQWLRALAPADLATRALPFVSALYPTAQDDERLLVLARALQPRASTLVEFAEQARFAYVRPTEYDDKAVRNWMRAESQPAFVQLIETLGQLVQFDAAGITDAMTSLAGTFGLGMGKIAQPVRIALTGGAVSPAIEDTLLAVGQQEAVARLSAALPLFSTEPAT